VRGQKLYEALAYAYELLKEQSETGHYPVSALAENGGKGYEPITKVLKECEGEYLNESSGLHLQRVNGWLEFYGNEQLFNDMAKLNCPCRFDDGSQCRYNEEHPMAKLTHFKIV